MNMVREGLVRQRTWSEDELSEARRLLEVCNAYEGLSLKLDVWMLRSRKGNEVNDFLYYEERISLRKAGPGDVEDLAVITATSFGHSIEGTKRNILRNMENPHVQYYLGKRGEEAVGCLNLDEGEKEFGIYAFAVLLPYRRRGFGRQMLELVIKQVRAASEKGIALEVETMNETA